VHGVLVLAAVERRRREFASAARTLTQADDAIAKGFRFFVPDVALERSRLCRAAGQPDRAEEQLDAVRRRLLAEGSFVEAARASLDLLALRVEAGRLDALSELTADLLDTFHCQRWALPPMAAIHWLANQAAQRSVHFRLAVAPVRHYISTLRRSPRDRPDLVADVRDLADHLLVAAHRDLGRAAAEEADPVEFAP